jgi:hypothetical protein
MRIKNVILHLRFCFLQIRHPCTVVFVPTAAASPLVLEKEERSYLQKLVQNVGLATAARELDISRSVVVSAVAGVPVRRGSIVLLQQAIVKHRTGGASK